MSEFHGAQAYGFVEGGSVGGRAVGDILDRLAGRVVQVTIREVTSDPWIENFDPSPTHYEFDHFCECIECEPTHFPAGMKEVPDQVGIRFGDRNWKVWLDGYELTGCFEAKPGVFGWVARYREMAADYPYRHSCLRCRRHACAEVLRGFVAVELMPNLEDAEAEPALA